MGFYLVYIEESVSTLRPSSILEVIGNDLPLFVASFPHAGQQLHIFFFRPVFEIGFQKCIESGMNLHWSTTGYKMRDTSPVMAE